MVYLEWNKKDIKGLDEMGIAKLYTEVDETGAVAREVGIDAHGDVIYWSPSKLSDYGLFDNQRIEKSVDVHRIGSDEFQDYWSRRGD